MSILNDPGIQKVWVGDRLIFDRATDTRHPMDVLGLVLFGGAEDVEQGSGDLCTGVGDSRICGGIVDPERISAPKYRGAGYVVSGEWSARHAYGRADQLGGKATAEPNAAPDQG